MKRSLLLFVILCASTLNGMKNPLHDQQRSPGNIMAPEIPVDIKNLIIIDYCLFNHPKNPSFTCISDLEDILINDYLSSYGCEIPSELKNILIRDYGETYNNLKSKKKEAIQKTALLKRIKNIKSISLINKYFNEKVNNQSLFTKIVYKLAERFSMPINIIVEQFKMPAAKKYQQLGLSLICACGATDWRVKVPEMIEQGADVNFNLTGRLAPLYTAVYLKNTELLKLLLDLGAKPILDECHQKANDIFFVLKKQIDAKNKDQM